MPPLCSGRSIVIWVRTRVVLEELEHLVFLSHDVDNRALGVAKRFEETATVFSLDNTSPARDDFACGVSLEEPLGYLSFLESEIVPTVRLHVAQDVLFRQVHKDLVGEESFPA